MSISAVSTGANTPPIHRAPTTAEVASAAGGAKQAAQTTATVTADGDSKVRTAHTSRVKDSDGDYKQVRSAASPAARSSSAVQSSLALLTKGG